MALPPFVIVHGGQKTGSAVFLGQTGWTKYREQAYSFDSDAQAADWLAEMIKTNPAMLANAKAKVERHEHKPKLDEAGGVTRLAEYEPAEE